ncbi:MAG: uracil-DNA glycosylase [Alphaproteobacteria bacterium]|nr:uracil-DNA glycosylase [Alphaproteobacteria bacterium]
MPDPALSPLAALAWLVESGADEAIADEPVDRFARPAPTREASAPSAMQFVSPPVPAPKPAAKFVSQNPTLPLRGGQKGDGDSIATAQALARSACSLEELRAALESFDGCALKKSCANTVFADGNPASRIMFIGEAPGREEDRQGLPFVGRAGKLLDQMMASIHLDRTRAYITNVLNWRPPENRDPSPEEAAMCLPFLRRHIELVNPGIIILLGAVAARHVMGFSEGIMKLRGRWLEYRIGEAMVPVLPTLHPAYLLRQPGHKKLAWRDLQAAENRMYALHLLEAEPSLR